MNPDIVLDWLIALYIFMLVLLMIGGMMVSSSGRLLTLLRALATNRSLAKVLFGKFGVVAAGGASMVTGSMKSVDAPHAGSQARADGPGITEFVNQADRSRRDQHTVLNRRFPMAKTMKAAVVHEFKQPLRIEEMPVPTPGPGQIVVKIAATGVCHTDLHAADGDWPVKPKPPFIPGHEGVGHVAAVGSGVSHVREGDRVGVPWLHTACGQCKHCLAAWETLCEKQQNTGYSVNGSFAEYVLADPDYVGHLPDNVDFVDAAPILCAGVTVYKGLKVTDTKPGDWVVISGIGGLGHLAVQYAKAMGLNVIGVDVDDSKLDLAKQLGASLAVNARKADPVAFIKKEVGGAQGVLVTAVSPKAFEQAMGMVGRGGTVSLNGLPPGTFPLSIFDTVLNGVTVRGSIVGTRLDLQEALTFAGEGKVKATIATDKLENINKIFARMHAGDIQGRIVIDFDS